MCLLSGPFLAALAILVLGSGCAGSRLWKSKNEFAKFGDGVPTAPLSPTVKPDAGGGIVQASATMPAGSNPSSFARMMGRGEKKVPATEITFMWRNRIDYLPDPSRNGEMGAGLAGQMFLFGPAMQFAPADGKLIVTLSDGTPRPPGQLPNKPEVWEFTKEVLKGLRTPDERFGMSYALFLPWPTYRPDVTRIRIAARFEPEHGHPLYAQETRITLDMRGPGNNGGGWTNQPFEPGTQPQPAGGFNMLGGPAPTTGPGMGVLASMPMGPAMPAVPMGTLQPAPPNYGSLPLVPAGPGAPTMPVNPATLPPIAIIAPRDPGR